jgi:hypothetical protein
MSISMSKSFLAGLLLFFFANCQAFGQSLPTPKRDWRYWPFSSTSPWNHPIGSGARYSTVKGLSSLWAGVNWDGKWTSSVVIATESDPLVNVRYNRSPHGPFSNWYFLYEGGSVCNNSSTVERNLLNSSTPTLDMDGNYYSTIAKDSQTVILPSDYHRARQNYRGVARLPKGACASPDTDGLMAVFQPDGWVLDMYNAVNLSTGDLVTAMASYVDAKGDGTGWWNGRRASMVPSFAGLIRKGELASGRIPHALAVQISATALKNEAVWPASAFDLRSGYSGTLPMGALLAIPPKVNIDSLKLSPRGKIIARAAQDYGIYIVDRGGTGGITLLGELGITELDWPASGNETAAWEDLQVIKNNLRWVTNNTSRTPGGGGTPRAPMAPDFIN